MRERQRSHRGKGAGSRKAIKHGTLRCVLIKEGKRKAERERKVEEKGKVTKKNRERG